MACSGRTDMANQVVPITVTAADRSALERLQRAPSTPAGVSRRVRAILLMAQGESHVEIAKRIGYTVVQVSRIRRRYAEGGVAGLHDRPKSGRPPTITARKRAQIAALTLKCPGGGGPPTGRRGIWPGRRGCRTARCIASGRRTPLSRTKCRPSNSPPTPRRKRKSTTWSACIWTRLTNAVVLTLDEKDADPGKVVGDCRPRHTGVT